MKLVVLLVTLLLASSVRAQVLAAPDDGGSPPPADDGGAPGQDGGALSDAADGGVSELDGAVVDADAAQGPSGDAAAPADAVPADFDPFAELEPVPAPTLAAPASTKLRPTDQLFRLDAVQVVGSLEREARTAPSSVYVLDEKTLERFNYDDAHQVLAQVPGVYVRQEDGYGLRPNIGMRGADSDRSKKVTLMEDGVLFGPAPYSAPAAYYFPLMTRMTGVEVIKGASAIRYGPQTIGGALDLRTRAVPDSGADAGADVSFGNTFYNKAHVFAGYGAARWGLLAEGVHVASDGFKKLDGGGNTGFSKQELMVKGRVNSDPNAHVYQRLEVKGGYSREDSRETYLGLSDQDFRKDPFRRYRASQLDRMKWWRTQAEAFHTLGVGEHFELRTAAYRHDFSRLWNRVDGFWSDVGAPPAINDVLRDPAMYPSEYDTLTGRNDSIATQTSILQAGNHRDFVSQGVQTVAKLDYETGPLTHAVELGLRVHQDSIYRHHTARSFDMVRDDASGEINLGNETKRPDLAKNKVDTLAFAGHVTYALTYRRLTLTPGLRTEVIRARYSERLGMRSHNDSNTQTVLLALGALYAVTDELSLLGGVQQGMSPVAPSSTGGSQPERANNYEAGVRYTDARGQGSVIGFVSDYDRIAAPCDDGTCNSGQNGTTFTGKTALIYGVEVGGNYDVQLPRAFALPLRASYTYTHAEFTSGFLTAYQPWGGADGRVNSGDVIPYIPPHQWSAGSGIRYQELFGLDVQVTFTDRMREVAGQGTPASNEHTDRYALLDASTYYMFRRGIQLYVKGDNLTNSQPIVSRRPFGARPNKPLLFQIGLRLTL